MHDKAFVDVEFHQPLDWCIFLRFFSVLIYMVIVASVAFDSVQIRGDRK